MLRFALLAFAIAMTFGGAGNASDPAHSDGPARVTDAPAAGDTGLEKAFADAVAEAKDRLGLTAVEADMKTRYGITYDSALGRSAGGWWHNTAKIRPVAERLAKERGRIAWATTCGEMPRSCRRVILAVGRLPLWCC